MNGIREIALSFCASAVFCAGAGMLGGGAIQKSGRYIFALIMLCSVVAAIASADINFDFFEHGQYEAAENASTEELSGFAAESLVADFLDKRGLKYEKIEAKVTKNGDGDIIINELKISGAQSPSAVEEALMDVGIDCRVVFD